MKHIALGLVTKAAKHTAGGPKLLSYSTCASLHSSMQFGKCTDSFPSTHFPRNTTTAGLTETKKKSSSDQSTNSGRSWWEIKTLHNPPNSDLTSNVLVFLTFLCIINTVHWKKTQFFFFCAWKKICNIQGYRYKIIFISEEISSVENVAAQYFYTPE